MRAASRPVEFAPGELPVLLGWAAVAIYGCVPETDQMPTIGAMVAGLFVIERVTRLPSALPIQLVATAIVLWSGLYGATGRGSAIVGAWFAFWALVMVLASAGVFGVRPSVERWVIGAIGGVAAVAVARTGAIEPTTGPALVAVAIAAPASLVLAWAAHSRRLARAVR
jgi:hypothetical protein